MKILKFTPRNSDLIKQGKKTTTFRLFDDKHLKVGDKVFLATRDGNLVHEFAKAEITEIFNRTIETLTAEDYIGHEPVADPLIEYREYYGDRVEPSTEVLVIRFKII